MKNLRYKLIDSGVEDSDVFDAADALERFLVFLLVVRDGFIRCGDAVHHAPSGETWVVAFADYERGELAWSGWPEGTARLLDCRLARRATDAQHAAHVSEWLDKPHQPGMRVARVQHLYRPEARS